MAELKLEVLQKSDKNAMRVTKKDIASIKIGDTDITEFFTDISLRFVGDVAVVNIEFMPTDIKIDMETR